MMDEKKQAFNPYLPSWEYVPDGEPYVFGDRLYLYGSHDFYNGPVFCPGDYVCWSAPVEDLGNWRMEGVIYKKTDDPENPYGKMCLYAPDVTQGPDGRYYLYYVLDKISVVSVAVCDTPYGKFEFYGYVRYEDGTRLGEGEQDEPQFDPGVLTEGDKSYLYTGFAAHGDTGRHGAMVTVLKEDMITIETAPVFVIPSKSYGQGTDFEGFEFFEAPSIRKRGNLYILIYSSVQMHELCYAYSENPCSGFRYGGVVVSNTDLHIDTYKPALMPAAYGANNHGSIIEIQNQWYVFYHRHTNNSWYSRQGCADKIEFWDNKTIRQAEMTSCGLNQGALTGKGEYPAFIACNLFSREESVYVGGEGFPRIRQDGRDGDTDPAYISNVTDGSTIGFKYFNMQQVSKIGIRIRGYAKGVFHVKTAWDQEPLVSIPVDFSNVWEDYQKEIAPLTGVYALYFTFEGRGTADFYSFTMD
ncbi:glycosyl hydrolase family 43 [Kineothrix alysoides]|uniref:Glycosyl hydrolase family 43 n=1 Tax=Kineothrix alysoides TaxID=1469948 RepID=A0A4R1R6I3_9FIRM|nr:family 43 glycosylhydrolase [Kineothrix alysoides]TCL61069.1 glycosyl hydrolase family 43 [Kineothrix alysoides]